MDKQQPQIVSLKQEIMLHVNKRLYIQGMISKELYEQARIKIAGMAV